MSKCSKQPPVRRERKSRFVRILRTTPAKTVCPNFYVLAHANGCAFSPRCSYCYLKSSFGHLRQQHVFTNVGRMLEEVRPWIRKDDLESYVLNTGNLSDSLAFEDERSILPQLVDVFREEAEAKGRPHALLLVTKGGTKECRTLFDMEPCQNVIISFSVNSPEAARKHERGAAPVGDRMKAAKRLKARGWRIRIRIDPMMLGFDYTWIVEKVRRLAPERVTLGSLRAEKNLYRHTKKGLFADLVKPEDDGRLALARYPLDRRLALYRQAAKVLKDVCPMGLCEEPPGVWNALGLDTDAKSCNCGY